MKKYISIVLAICLCLCGLSGCVGQTDGKTDTQVDASLTVSDTKKNDDIEQSENIEQSEDIEPAEHQGSDESSDSGLYTLIIPKSISDLYSETVEESVAEYNAGTTTVPLGSLGDEIPIRQAFTDVYANDDGLLTLVFTPEQLELYKQRMRDLASFREVMQMDGSPVKNVELTSDLTGIIVYLSGYDNYDVSDAAAAAMGFYQLANGTDPNEWTAHVVVKDYETGEIISENDYPAER